MNPFYFHLHDPICLIFWSPSFYYVYIYCSHFELLISVILVDTISFCIIVSNDSIVVEVESWSLSCRIMVILVIVMLSCRSKFWSFYC